METLLYTTYSEWYVFRGFWDFYLFNNEIRLDFSFYVFIGILVPNTVSVSWEIRFQLNLEIVDGAHSVPGRRSATPTLEKNQDTLESLCVTDNRRQRESGWLQKRYVHVC